MKFGMRIMRFVPMFVALAFGLVSCDKGGDDAKQPTPPPTPSDVVEYQMTTAERVVGADVDLELAENEFMLLFDNAEQGVRMSLHLVGAESDTVLQSGDYSTGNGGLIAANSGVGVADSEIYFKEGSVSVTLSGESYAFDVEFVGDDDKQYRVLYAGEVQNMVVGGDVPSGAFVPVKVVAETNDNWDLGNFMLQLYLDDTRYHELDMYDTTNPNRNYLSEGHYTTADGSIGKWSIFNTALDQNCGVLEAEIDLVINDDKSVKLTGYIKSEEEYEITIEWQGVVEGFNFTETPEPTPGDSFTAKVLDITYYGQEYSDTYNYYVILSDNGMDGNNMQKNSTYYFFDLYSNVAGKSSGGKLPNGSYILEEGRGVNTFNPDDSYRAITSEDKAEYKMYKEAVVTVSDNGIEAQIQFEDGSVQSVSYVGPTTYGDGGSTEAVTLTADDWVWGGTSNYGNYYTASADNFSIDVHFAADVATATELKAGEYKWVSTSFFGYEDYPHFTTRSFKLDGQSVVVDSGSAKVMVVDGEYVVELTLNSRDGAVYAIKWQGALESSGGGRNEAIELTSMKYKDYNSSYYFYSYTLADDKGNSLDLLINDMQSNESKVYSGDYEWITKSLCGGLEYFSTDNIVVNGKSYKAQSGFMYVSCEEDNKLAIAFELEFADGTIQPYSFYGYVTH